MKSPSFRLVCASLVGLVIFISLRAVSGRLINLHEAARRSDYDTLKRHVQSARDANKVNNEGETLLISAAEGGEEKIVRFLLSKGANINAKDQNGQTPLYRAVSAGNTAVAKLLIKRGADLRLLYGEKKETLLFAAVRIGDLDVIRELVKARPQLLTEKNVDGETALFEAVRSAQSEAARLLIELGIDSEVRNKSGLQARQLADPEVDEEVLKILDSAKKRK